MEQLVARGWIFTLQGGRRGEERGGIGREQTSLIFIPLYSTSAPLPYLAGNDDTQPCDGSVMAVQHSFLEGEEGGCPSLVQVSRSASD